MITMQAWNESGKPFSRIADIGDVVEDAIVEYFREVVPPVTNRHDIMQCGEPFSTNAYGQPTYTTFKRNDAGQWEYCLDCPKITNIVPEAVKRNTFGCVNCLYAGCECKSGSKYTPKDKDGCGSYVYYD